MALNTNPNSSARTATGFTPAVAPEEGTVQVVLLQRKGTEKDGSSDPRQRVQGRDGSPDGGRRNQVLMDLVGVIVDGVCYPDYSGKTKLPKLGSDEFKALAARPCGIKVKSIYASGQAELRQAIVDGYLNVCTLEQYDKAVENNTVNTLFGTAGAALDALGLMETQEWTIGDILFGSKSISVNLLKDGEGDAYATSFTDLRGHFGFANVAFAVTMGDTLQATDLTVNGITTPTYSPDGVYFEWTKVAGPMGRPTYKLDPVYAISGAKFATGSTSAANASDLARRSMSAAHEGASTAVSNRSTARQDSMKRMATAGQNVGAGAGAFDTSGL